MNEKFVMGGRGMSEAEDSPMSIRRRCAMARQEVQSRRRQRRGDVLRVCGSGEHLIQPEFQGFSGTFRASAYDGGVGIEKFSVSDRDIGSNRKFCRVCEICDALRQIAVAISAISAISRWQRHGLSMCKVAKGSCSRFCAVYGSFSGMLLRWFENSRVYHPSRDLEVSGADLRRPFEDVFFKAADEVELNGWFYPAEEKSQVGEMVFLNCHGNGGNIADRLGLYQAMLETGAAVLTFDYRGYGRSKGKPSEEGTYLDAQAAYRWLRQKSFAARNIIVYGESLGGGIGSELCLREEAGGLVLQSTFTSLPDIGAELYPYLPVRWMGRIKYDTKGKLPRIRVPVLVMHSREDGFIGFRHSEQNFAAANEPKFFAELLGGHNDPAWEAPEFEGALEKFLACVRERNAEGRAIANER